MKVKDLPPAASLTFEGAYATSADVQKLMTPCLIAQAQGQCEVLVTIDQGFEHEHNLKKLTFGIVIVHVKKNRMEYYRPLFPTLLDAVEHARAGEVMHVSGPPV